jgi:hypothetical protein
MSRIPLRPRSSARTTEQERVVSLCDGVVGVVRMAGALHDSGRAVSLDGLGDMVGLLCARTLDLPPEQSRALRPCLADLDRALADLAARIAEPLLP